MDYFLHNFLLRAMVVIFAIVSGVDSAEASHLPIAEQSTLSYQAQAELCHTAIEEFDSGRLSMLSHRLRNGKQSRVRTFSFSGGGSERSVGKVMHHYQSRAFVPYLTPAMEFNLLKLFCIFRI